MTDHSDGDGWEPRGPWVLAIETVVIGSVAVLVTSVRRFESDSSRTRSHRTTDDRSRPPPTS